MLPSQMVMRFILKYSVHQKWPDAFKFIKKSTKCSKYSILRSLLISLEYTFFFVFFLGCCCWSLQIYKLVWPLVLLAKKMRFPLMAHIFMWIGRLSSVYIDISPGTHPVNFYVPRSRLETSSLCFFSCSRSLSFFWQRAFSHSVFFSDFTEKIVLFSFTFFPRNHDIDVGREKKKKFYASHSCFNDVLDASQPLLICYSK